MIERIHNWTEADFLGIYPSQLPLGDSTARWITSGWPTIRELNELLYRSPFIGVPFPSEAPGET